MIHYTVEAILTGLRNSDNEILGYIYKKYYPEIRFFVIKNSGNDEDAKDTFQEALIIIYKKLKAGNLELTCSFKTYLYSVSRLVWMRYLEKNKVKMDELNDRQVFVDFEDNMELYMSEQERYRMYQKYFLTLHKDCQTILKLFLQKVPLKEIQKKLNLSSEKYVKKRKYQCKEILVKRIKNDPNYKLLSDER